MCMFPHSRQGDADELSSCRECGGEQVELSGAVSSQYLTALLMAAPLAKGSEGITIKIRDELVSQPYVDMTVRLMERFGVKVSSALHARHDFGHVVISWTVLLFRVMSSYASNT